MAVFCLILIGTNNHSFHLGSSKLGSKNLGRTLWSIERILLAQRTGSTGHSSWTGSSPAGTPPWAPWCTPGQGCSCSRKMVVCCSIWPAALCHTLFVESKHLASHLSSGRPARWGAWCSAPSLPPPPHSLHWGTQQTHSLDFFPQSGQAPHMS